LCYNFSNKLYFTTKFVPESGPALNVEMTSYVLLSLVKLGSNQDLLKARSIVRWLSKQRNSEGGFVSTQDTVVALQVMTHLTKRKA
jgi:prenyltransferase beta subunit